MSKINYYTREKEINGVKYVAQFNGLSAAIDAIDESYIAGSSNTSIKKLSEQVFKNVIVEPSGLKIDDFEDLDEMNEVLEFGRDVMQGKFRSDSKSNLTIEKKSK